MPGKVVMVNKKVGDAVKVGDVVLILEAMKMENEITSDKDGKITEVRVIEGDSVDAHDVLVVVG
jgi:biotin carboxyl carrier protein